MPFHGVTSGTLTHWHARLAVLRNSEVTSRKWPETGTHMAKKGENQGWGS